MTYQLENNVLILKLAGRVDSTNAPAVQEEADRILTENPAEKHVLDVDDLEYISSAGLRMILKLRKTYGDLSIRNANTEVYEVLEMTGFTEMLPVERAKRKLSVEGCEVIGQGSNGKVYRLDPDTIIKVYFNADALPDIERERDLAKKAFVLGINTAIPYDVVRVGDTYGSVFELLNADLLSSRILNEPENFDQYMDMYIDLMKEIHATLVKPGDMPDMREVALGWTRFLKDYFDEADYNKMYAMVEAVPRNDHMMHGDYHVKNVMLQNGETILIDMDTLSVGDPVFEFASVYLAYLGFSALNHDNVMKFLGIPYDVAAKIWDRTLHLYFPGVDEETLAHYANRAQFIGFIRLMRRTIRREGDTEEGKALIAHCKKTLLELLEKEDHLTLD